MCITGGVFMPWDEILDLLGQGEGQSVEFEKQVSTEDDIARELVAFANSDGGKIIYGIDDKNKHLIGIQVDDDIRDKILDIGTKRCAPPIKPEVEIIDRDSRKILVLTVTEGDEKPYKADDICYLRDGAVSRPAKDTEEKEITNPWGGKGLNKRQLRAMQIIAEHGSISNREFRDAFNVSHKTAHLELTMLADKKLVLTQGSGRSTCYVLPNPIE
jgi:predicted HTH transcriptional regulator